MLAGKIISSILESSRENKKIIIQGVWNWMSVTGCYLYIGKKIKAEDDQKSNQRMKRLYQHTEHLTF